MTTREALAAALTKAEWWRHGGVRKNAVIELEQWSSAKLADAILAVLPQPATREALAAALTKVMADLTTPGPNTGDSYWEDLADAILAALPPADEARLDVERLREALITKGFAYQNWNGDIDLPLVDAQEIADEYARLSRQSQEADR